MKKKLFIRKITALVMLMLFALSITPKKVLHDLIADHQDQKCTIDHTHDANGQMATKQYHCQTDNLVVVSPFENSFFSAELIINSDYKIVNESLDKKIFSLKYNVVDLRGPPFC